MRDNLLSHTRVDNLLSHARVHARTATELGDAAHNETDFSTVCPVPFIVARMGDRRLAPTGGGARHVHLLGMQLPVPYNVGRCE